MRPCGTTVTVVTKCLQPATTHADKDTHMFLTCAAHTTGPACSARIQCRRNPSYTPTAHKKHAMGVAPCCCSEPACRSGTQRPPRSLVTPPLGESPSSHASRSTALLPLKFSLSTIPVKLSGSGSTGVALGDISGVVISPTSNDLMGLMQGAGRPVMALGGVCAPTTDAAGVGAAARHAEGVKRARQQQHTSGRWLRCWLSCQAHWVRRGCVPHVSSTCCKQIAVASKQQCTHNNDKCL
jgi:hypothetical protein